MSYERPNILRMNGYVPGEQPDDPQMVKLNTNENPYPPTDAVMKALREIPADDLRRYPQPMAEDFCKAAAKMHGVDAENIIAANAGDEVLRLAITTFVEPGKPIGTADPSYSLYPVLADVHGSHTVRVPLEEDWSLGDDFASRMNGEGVQLTFLVNPHAPSGIRRPVDRLAQVAEQLDGVLLIDEAYINFVAESEQDAAVALIKQFDNVLILRTLSKGYSLAGLRFGYAIGPVNLIEPMRTKTKDSYNTDVIAQRLAIAAIQSRAEAAKTWESVRNERTRVAAALAELGLHCPPSEANFVLAKHADAAAIYQSLKQQHIYVRYFDEQRLRDKLRITIGTPTQNDALLAALRNWIGSK